MARWIVLALLISVLYSCASTKGMQRKAQEDIPSSVTSSPLPCFFWRW
jgi:hypothetical protein